MNTYDVVIKRDGYECRYCGHKFNDAQEPILDHVLPRSQGGGDTSDNLVVSCNYCNCKKGGRTPEQAGMPLRPIPDKPMLKRLSTNLPWDRDKVSAWEHLAYEYVTFVDDYSDVRT